MTAPLIEIKEVHKRYASKVVHSGVSIDVKQGEILALMGGSGSGKSVLLRSLIGLERIDGGEIHFKGQRTDKLSEDQFVEIRKQMAYVFQYGALFDSLTVEENLSYPLIEHTKLSPKQIKDKVKQTLKTLGLDGTQGLLPSGLSGGMQRRVGVARSIIMDPEVILYDEPTTGLDPYNTQQILKIILQLKASGTTAVLVTHDMEAIFAVADRVAFLQKGKIIKTGTVTDFKNTTDPDISGYIRGERP